jgi:flagellar basal body-associated protein FliL
MADRTDKKPKQVAIRLPIIIVIALLVMLVVAYWAYNRG